MNIFAVDTDPREAARLLPDKYTVKMPVETAQMLSIIMSPWYLNWGPIFKKDGTPFSTERGAFRNHPCIRWAATDWSHLKWLIQHGLALCHEYTARYSKVHACEAAISGALDLYYKNAQSWTIEYGITPNSFVRAMPDDLKNNIWISSVEAYRRYLNTKPWITHNYVRLPERKPSWLL